MVIYRLALWMLSAGLLASSAGNVSGQNYPNKPIRIVTAEFGGNGDFTARLIAQGIAGGLGQQIVVDNRGGTVIIPVEVVAKAPPDGYTLLSNGSSMWILPLLESTPYDPVKDFAPIALTTTSPGVLVVHPSVPVKSVKELIALAKARPGELNNGSAPTGSYSHVAAELFKSMAGVNIVGIAYKGAGPALNALISGQVQFMFGSASSVAPHVASGRLRVLGVTSAEPSALAPGLPTIAASGVPGYESGSMQGIWAPLNTPAPIIHRLNQEVVRALNQAEVKKRLLSIGVEAVGSSPEQLVTAIKSEMLRLGKVIKSTGIREK